MKTLSEVLGSLYNIDNISMLETMTNNVLLLMNNRSVNESLNNTLLRSVKRIVLVGELFSNSIQRFKNDNIKVDYADPTTLSYKIKNDVISIKDEKSSFTIKTEDADNTIVLMRSGYNNQNICYLLDEIKELGILILNDVAPIKLSSNKYNTALLLDKNGIPQPKYCLITSNDVSKDDHSKLEEKISKLYDNVDDDTKFVCKILGGHGGKGVFICRKSNIVSICQCIFKLKEDTLIIVLDFKPIKDGDIRVNVLTLNGRQEIFDVCMRKKVSDDFRTNLSLGNKVDNNIVLTKHQEDLAKNAAKVSGLAWAGIDLLPTENGTYVLEINGAPGPMSDINSEDSEEVNYKFYKKLIDMINSLC